MNLFLLGVSFAILVSLDSRLVHHVLPGGHTIIVLSIILVLMANFVIKGVFSDHIIRISKMSLAYISIMVAYTIGALGEYAKMEEIIMSYFFITFIFLNGLYIKKYDCLSAFISVSYYTIFAFFVLIIIMHRIDLISIVKNINLRDFFSTKYYRRSRYAFGFYNPNALGNICTCELTLVFYLLKKTNISALRQVLSRIIELVVAAFFLIALLSSGSRSAVVSFAFFIAFIMLINNEYYNQINTVLSFFIKSMSIVLLMSVIIEKGVSFFIEYYLNSGRNKAFSNFRLINGIKNHLFGLGLFVPGEIRRMYVDGYRGDILDNYYIYVYMTMGIVGGLFILSSIFYLFWRVYRNKLKPMGTYIIALFAELLVYGTAETCVIYYMFVSSMIFLSIVCGFCNKYYQT